MTHRTHTLVSCLAVACLALAAGCSAAESPDRDQGPTSTPSASQSPTAPAGPDETSDVPEEQGAPPPTPTAAPPAENPQATAPQPRVTYAVPGAAGFEVAAVVPDVIEEGGSCRFDAQGPSGQTVSATTVAVADAASTSCGSVELALAPGSWTLRVTYDGTAGSGSSEPVAVEVQ